MDMEISLPNGLKYYLNAKSFSIVNGDNLTKYFKLQKGA